MYVCVVMRVLKERSDERCENYGRGGYMRGVVMRVLKERSDERQENYGRGRNKDT